METFSILLHVFSWNVSLLLLLSCVWYWWSSLQTTVCFPPLHLLQTWNIIQINAHESPLLTHTHTHWGTHYIAENTHSDTQSHLSEHTESYCISNALKLTHPHTQSWPGCFHTLGHTVLPTTKGVFCCWACWPTVTQLGYWPQPCLLANEKHHMVPFIFHTCHVFFFFNQCEIHSIDYRGLLWLFNLLIWLLGH